MSSKLDLSQHASNWTTRPSEPTNVNACLSIEAGANADACLLAIQKSCHDYGATAREACRDAFKVDISIDASSYYAISVAQQKAMEFGAVQTHICNTMTSAIASTLQTTHQPEELAEILHKPATTHVSDGELDGVAA